VQVNIPLLELLADIPPYAKFLKDFYTKKRKTKVAKWAFLAKEVSSLLLGRTSLKWDDPRTHVISYLINGYTLDRTLVDLGARINLMPTHIFKMLNFEALKPTRMVVQLVDKSVRYLEGQLEDIIKQVYKFTYVVDFVVMEVQSTSIRENNIPLILGRPFLAIAGATINYRTREMKLTYGSDSLVLNVF
jgi:hypothetical protein